MMRTARSCMVFLAVIALAACPKGIYVGLGDSVRADSLTIVVGDEHTSATRVEEVDMLSIYTCPNEGHTPRWIIERFVRGPRFSVRRVLYGRVPSGWTATHSAEPLAPGCYSVSVGGSSGVSGGFAFDVDAGGIIRKR